MTPANFGAVRLPFLAAAVLALLAAPVSSQVVEKGRTLADLIAVHPCDAETDNRIARVTDCDAVDDVGDGGGAFNCWVSCDGSAPWVTQAIGGGGGAGGPATALESPVVIEGTPDAFEGNFTFADPTADWTLGFGATGLATFPSWVIAERFVVLGLGGTSELEDLQITSSKTISFSNGVDYGRGITGSGVTGPVVKVTSALNLSPLASPPRTCDATAEGDIYSDTSHALCWCDASTWQKLSGAGTCA